MLLPVTCPVCSARGAAPCASCVAALRPAPVLAVPDGLDRCVAVLSYCHEGRELVARLKYRNVRAATAWLAESMAALVDPTTVDVISEVPTTAARRRARGFDQAALLASAVARRLSLPRRTLLRRNAGPPQTGRSLAERRQGPSFGAVGRPPRRVLLVDDVVTSGATLTVAARVLRAAGAVEVSAVAAARTPAPAPAGRPIGQGPAAVRRST